MSAVFQPPTFSERAGSVVTTGLRQLWRSRRPLVAYMVVSYACLFAYLAMFGFPQNDGPAVMGLEKRQVLSSDGRLVSLNSFDWTDDQWDAAADSVINSPALGAYFDTQPGWGGWGTSKGKVTSLLSKCYRQERTAMFLNLFLGVLGIDQWYAHHWPLAVFKMLTLGGFGLWAFIDQILWMVGGVYGTPGCAGTWRH